MPVINDAPGDDYCSYCAKEVDYCKCEFDYVGNVIQATHAPLIEYGTGCTVPESCHPFFYDDWDN